MSQPLPPGTRVRVIDGMFVGTTGVVITADEAKSIHTRRSGQRSPLRDVAEGYVWVVLSIFGQIVPIELAIPQLKALS
jgi:transcription antitermination factor NusG